MGAGPDGYQRPSGRQGFDYYFGYENHWHAHNYYPSYLFRNHERIELPNVVRNVRLRELP